ncbi:hypothetical protein [Metasolibacillus sp.]|uniref:hypothetical protein n=1 Tax=Metasolibacillus sp. TaxID=2703680 RepID=UPI0025E74E84|nr:hypothetical protein [Metasolibacillus sp.]MCT6922780.1 hypothetical protein [Metasolibacillus sp.]MCT6938881.1 hypothetical protein [Metasolibacillus sp.]
MSTFLQRIMDSLEEQADWNVTTTVSRMDLIQLVDAYHNILEQQGEKFVEKKTDIEIGNMALVQNSRKHWFCEIEDIYTSEIGEPNLYKLKGSGLYTKDQLTVSKYHETFTDLGLAIAENLVERINAHGGEAWISISWHDYGQKWSWETILCKNNSLGMTVQLLSPRDFREMNDGTFNRHTKVLELAGVLNEATRETKPKDADYGR